MRKGRGGIGSGQTKQERERNVDIQDIKEYNKIVIDVAKEVSKPWKWSTFILSLLLLCMLALYFFNPTTFDLDANNNNNSFTEQKG